MPINSSTHQPFNLWLVSTFQPGPADGAKRLNPPPPEGLERVWMEIELVFEFFEIIESSQAPSSPQKPPASSELISWASQIAPKSVQKSIKILMSLWSRFWRLLGPFGPPFWSLLAAQIGSSSAQEAPRSPQDAPRWSQDRPR